ncbi:hypothetical protein ACT8ZV_07040 [Nocardioides sp. MAHUQ-72]|uniref:hypothetical protein n=1 Tax=unclassified Nocardioides TaxID=2615069 RepID=UPI00361F75CC
MSTTLTGRRRWLLLGLASVTLATVGVVGSTATVTATAQTTHRAATAKPVALEIDLYVAARKADWAQDKIERPGLWF